MRFKILTAATAAVTLSLGAANARATLLVYEGFDYTTGQDINGKGINVPTPGASGYGFVTGSTYTASAVDVVGTNLSYAGSFTAGSGFQSGVGGSMRGYIGGGNQGQYGLGSTGSVASNAGGRPYAGTTTAASVVPAGTYYYSFLWNRGVDVATPAGYFNVMGRAEVGANNSYQQGIGIRFIGGTFASNDTDGGSALGASVSGVNYTNTTSSYLIVGKVVINATANQSTNQFWVNPTTFATNGTVSGGSSSPLVTYTTYGTSLVKSTLTARTNGGGNGWLVDEVRVGTLLSDVVTIASATSTISLTTTAQNTQLALGGNVAVTGSAGNFVSEVDELSSNQNKGSATVAVTPGALSSPVYAMLWLTGQDATTLETLRSTLDAIANVDAYTGVAGGDQYTTLNAGAYSGFNLLVKFTGAAAANPGAVNWDFGAQSSILVDKIAVVPEPTVMAGILGLGSLGLLGRRRRQA